MDKLFLNIVDGDRKRTGFINIGTYEMAELYHDVRRGLPFRSSSIQGIYAGYFIEKLSQSEGAAFLRECRRVLVNKGRLRIACTDLDLVVQDYQRGNLDTISLGRKGNSHVRPDHAEKINHAMRSQGRTWLYNQEELVRVGNIVGLKFEGRFKQGDSNDPMFCGLENQEEPGLICEFIKDRPPVINSQPLVSILIPAFNYRYFKDSLESALTQTYSNLEIIVCDDSFSFSNKIKNICSRYKNDLRLRYVANEKHLGEYGNFLKLFDLSKGAYIKFLNDDDMLHTECVARMVHCLNRFPDVTLVTSHRQCIDQNGNYLPDIAATKRPVSTDSLIDGTLLAAKMIESRLNFIGEPSTVMFRKIDIADTKPNIISFDGRQCISNGDMTMWMNLLSKGDGIYLQDTLSFFRLHSEQSQQKPEMQKRGLAALEQLVFDGTKMGLTNTNHSSRPLVQEIKDTRFALDELDIRTMTEFEFSEPKVSIIIPLFNSVEFTRKCLEKLSQNTTYGLFEVILVDNGSTDGTKEFLQTLSRYKVTIISNQRNLGFAKACNQGANTASGEYLLFLHNDTGPQPGWIEPLLEVLDKDTSVVGVGSKLLFPDGTIQHAGVVIVEDKKISDPLHARHIYLREKADLPEVNVAMTYQALTGACFMVRKKAFDNIGGFDEGYWNGYEDIDLCFKLTEKGHLLVYQPQSIVIHYESQSGPERFAKVSENISRLHKKWIGKIKPDIIINEDGKAITTNAGKIRRYFVLGLPQNQLISATPTSSKANLVSIVILTFNQLEHTKLCLQSIEKYTPQPYELILVDNGSTDGTLAYYRKYATCHNNIHVIANKENLGFAAGNNQGLALANGDYVLLLNNDTVVTEGWLSRMLLVFERYLEVGIVGPMSNYVTGPQQVKGASYQCLEEMHHFAKQWSTEHAGQTMEVQRLVGFCLLAKREVIDRIGGLDEQFGIGNFEDDDFCLRAAAAGYKARIAQDAFVHHTGSQTFKGAGINCQKTGEYNWEIFKKKWKLPQDLPIGTNYTLVLDIKDLSQYYIPLKAKAGKFQSIAVKEIPSLVHPEFKEGITSVIIPVQSVHLNACIECIKKYTEAPHEIILLEHDAAPKLKKQIVKATKGNQNYKFIKIDKSLNFTQSLNEGINQSTGEYIVILFDDVMVCEGWLSDMLECLKSGKNVGIVGAVSNNASSLQKEDGVDINLVENRLSFRERNRYRYIQTRCLDGFCLLFRRELLIQIGLFDEIFGANKHVFDDLCVRAELEGYHNVIAGNVFVHSHGGIDRLLSQDKTLFDEKWRGLDGQTPLTETALNNDQRSALYQFIQDLSLKNPEMAVLFSLSVNPDLICEVSDLPQLRLYLKIDGVDNPDERLQLFNDTGISEWIHTISSEDLRKVQDAWDMVVLTASDLLDQKLEDFLISTNFKLLVVSDSLSSIDENRQAELLEYFLGIGFQKIHENPDVFSWKDKSLWGEYLFSKGLTLEAIKTFKQALVDNPDNDNVLNNIGVISYQLKQYGAAENFLVRAVGLNRRNSNSLNNLVQLYIALERFEEAAGLLTEITGMNPDQPEPWYLLGLCMERLNHLDEAFDAFKKAEALDGSAYPMPEAMQAHIKTSYHQKICQKILVINNLYPPQELGGYGRLLYDFTNRLRKRGHSVYVLTSDTPYLGTTEGDLPDVHRELALFGGWQGGVCKAIDSKDEIVRIVKKNLVQLEKVIQEYAPDVCLLGNIDFLSRNILDPLLNRQIPIVHHLGNQHPGYLVQETPKSRLYQLATASNWLKEEVLKQGYPLKDIRIVYPGALVEEFRMRIPPACDKLRIAYASIVLPYKGPHLLIEALKTLHEMGIDFSCTLAGTSTNEDFVQSLKNFVSANGIDEKIRFAGFLQREQLKDLFATHNVLVFPSIVQEAFGISQVEAMAAGLLVVSSGTGGAKEIVEHGVSGLLFQSENAASLAETLVEVVKDTQRWQRIALAGQKRAIEVFDIERSVDAIEECFERLLKIKKG